MTSNNIRSETVKRTGMRLSQMIWYLFRVAPSKYIVKVLDINPGLSSQVELEIGTVVNFPLDELSDTEASPEVIKPWD